MTAEENVKKVYPYARLVSDGGLEKRVVSGIGSSSLILSSWFFWGADAWRQADAIQRLKAERKAK